VIEEGQTWARGGERIRIQRVWKGRNSLRPEALTVHAKIIDGNPTAYFAAPGLGPGEFLASPEWIKSRYEKETP